MAVVALASACNREATPLPPTTDEEAINQGYLAVVPAPEGAYAELELVRYIILSDSACELLSTYLLNSAGERVARIDEYPLCRQLSAAYNSSFPVTFDWASTPGFYCNSTGRTRDLVEGAGQQICFRWSRGETLFVAYASLSAKETVNLVRNLDVIAEP